MEFGCKSPNWRLHQCDSLQLFGLLGWMFGILHGSLKTPNLSYFFGWMLFFFWGGEVTEQKWLTGFIYMDGWEKGHPLQDFNSSQWMALFNYLSEWATIVEGLKFESLKFGTWNDLVYDIYIYIYFFSIYIYVWGHRQNLTLGSFDHPVLSLHPFQPQTWGPVMKDSPWMKRGERPQTSHAYAKSTLQETNISHLGKRKIIDSKVPLTWGYVCSLEGSQFPILILHFFHGPPTKVFKYCRLLPKYLILSWGSSCFQGHVMGYSCGNGLLNDVAWKYMGQIKILR